MPHPAAADAVRQGSSISDQSTVIRQMTVLFLAPGSGLRYDRTNGFLRRSVRRRRVQSAHPAVRFAVTFGFLIERRHVRAREPAAFAAKGDAFGAAAADGRTGIVAPFRRAAAGTFLCCKVRTKAAIHSAICDSFLRFHSITSPIQYSMSKQSPQAGRFFTAF
jgi:hypothetical protein